MMQNTLKIRTLAQLTQGQDWRLTLAHDRPDHLIIWITRGQGRLLLDGQRRGVGTHNAIIIPARQLFALDLGKQGIGQAVIIPDATDVTLPQMPRLLRIRDAAAMNELTTLLEAANREQAAQRPLVAQSMDAYGTLISVWVQRQLGLEEHAPSRRNAAARLSAAYCARITAHFADTLTMADHAESLGVTATHLTRACKAATGKTAADLLTERVLYEARSLLISTKVPAQDIARHLGFGSAAYFTRFMQHHTNATPTALRKASVQQSQAA
ncbi:AraC family transcriptional regulator [Roseobacter sp. YSTF-M11]|uniref:AraC family transcriptional regulator n=1 Tax=Roseobacter insulae TaxID=2859783 RepID=A0A9X1K115_9RHOB|nr:AraC family transcriptional regulator [Roseobacter insulae]MBW4708764.1 AraC family transcriptional regulator [Roseobacter insulae]